MHFTLTIGRALLIGVCTAWMALAAGGAAQADILSRLARIGSKADAPGLKLPDAAPGFSRAAAVLQGLPADTKAAASLAAHATPEGHWKFANRDGDVFTAGSPEELARAVPVLLPEAGSGTSLNLYLSEASVFRDRKLLADLPSGANLHIVAGKSSYPLVRRNLQGSESLRAAVRPGVLVELDDAAAFTEAVALLERRLSRADIRVVALEPGTTATLPSSPRFDVDSKQALVDAVDPAALPAALSTLRGQTVLLTGRVDAGMLRFRPSSGSEQAIRLDEVTRAAAASDVNLVIVHAADPRQPGGRNWLWQPIAVGGLDNALKRATFADFLEAFAASLGDIGVGIDRGTQGRVLLRAAPLNQQSDAITGVVGDWWSSAVSSITGDVVASSIEVHARDSHRQQELDLRIVPFIPSWVQFIYLAALAVGVMGWAVAGRWFAMLWPPEQRAEYRGAAGYRLAQGVRFLAFLLVFLPLVGIPALIATVLQQAWSVLTLPVRAFRWISARPAAGAG
jgi:hypothetical protein